MEFTAQRIEDRGQRKQVFHKCGEIIFHKSVHFCVQEGITSVTQCERQITLKQDEINMEITWDTETIFQNCATDTSTFDIRLRYVKTFSVLRSIRVICTHNESINISFSNLFIILDSRQIADGYDIIVLLFVLSCGLCLSLDGCEIEISQYHQIMNDSIYR